MRGPEAPCQKKAAGRGGARPGRRLGSELSFFKKAKLRPLLRRPWVTPRGERAHQLRRMYATLESRVRPILHALIVSSVLVVY